MNYYKNRVPVNNLLFYMVMLCCLGCTNNPAPGNRPSQNGNLHYRLATSPGSEPMAFFQYHGSYQLYYLAPGEAAAGNNVAIARATSKDLIHWTQSPTFILPGITSSIFYGGIIIDSNNTSGYGSGQNPPIVALLTRTETEDSNTTAVKKVIPFLAFSIDGGDSWTADSSKVNLPGRLIENSQDINVAWFGPSSKWIMTLAITDHVEIFSSPDLRNWTLESKLGAEFFPEDVKWNRTALFLSGDNNTWVLLANIKKSGVTRSSGGTVYFAGEFDGHQFVNRSAQLHWLDYGEDVYGSLLATANDRRRISMAWKNNETQLTAGIKRVSETTLVPRELGFENVNGEFFLRVSPPKELNSIHLKQSVLRAANVSYKAGNHELTSGLNPPFELFLKFKTVHIQKGSFPTRVGVSLWSNKEEHLEFGYDRFGFYYLDTTGLKTSSAPLPLNSLMKMPYDHTDTMMDLHIIVDSSTIECFAEGGKLVMTSSFTAGEPFTTLKLFALNGNIEFTGGKVVELDPGKNSGH